MEEENQLTDSEWLNLFKQAESLGIGFILLAGGEPLLRPEMIETAGIQEAAKQYFMWNMYRFMQIQRDLNLKMLKEEFLKEKLLELSYSADK
jgi:MoaA/NifB/PqqE/SkfB family radical SAM enzyme